MTRSSEVARLRVQLSAETGVSVLVQWTTCVAGQQLQWHVIWAGGPTVNAMTALVDRLLPAASALDRNALVYLRTVHPVSVVLAVVRNLRLGLGPLGDHVSAWDLELHLHDVPYPERGAAADLELATELCRLAEGDTHQITTLAAQYGLDGLRSHLDAPERELPNNVLPFRRPDRP